MKSIFPVNICRHHVHKTVNISSCKRCKTYERCFEENNVPLGMPNRIETCWWCSMQGTSSFINSLWCVNNSCWCKCAIMHWITVDINMLYSLIVHHSEVGMQKSTALDSSSLFQFLFGILNSTVFLENFLPPLNY